MNDTFYYELKENVSNLKSLSKKLCDYVDTLLTPNLSVEKGILINMLRTFANQIDITYYYFELVETKIDSDDPLSPVIKYFEGLLTAIGNSVDLLIDLINENFDGNDNAYKNLVKYILRLIDCSIIDLQDSVFMFEQNPDTDNSEEE